MAEHAALIAHLLDPTEVALITQARQMQAAFMQPAPLAFAGGADGLMQKAVQIRNFKAAGEQGIKAGSIKSIIPLALASHVRREAEHFIDELRRAS
jgi:hypothetical protein